MKYFIAATLVLFFILTMSVDIGAVTTGVCSNCHTMHNSQNGQAVIAGGPVEFLLNKGGGSKTHCWGCHAQGLSVNVDAITGAPQVSHTNATDLAAGNFAYITGSKSLGTGTTTFTAGHNVTDTSVTDSTLTSPPGDQYTTGVTNLNLTCAGQYGCHGDRSVATTGTAIGIAIKGAHHTNDNVLKFGTINTASQGGTTGTSYRFLKGVKGGEDSDWQKTSSATDHNEYFGATGKGTESTKTTPGGSTINGLCGECHGVFHGPAVGDITSGTGSPWLRHPTDIVLTNSGEYTSYTAYSLTAPVARTVIPTNLPSGTVTPGTDVVMCLSCHRAHASAYYKSMRWDIKSATLSTAISGCNVCHTSKN